MAIQIVGFCLAIVGCVGTILICGLPMWKMSAFIGELQVARALICVSIAVTVLAIGFTVVGARCTSFCSYDLRTKTNYGIAGGVVFILAGLLCLIPVSWSAYTIITGFYNPLTADGRQGELGASIYVGWISGALLVIGGGMLCGTYRS
ncbi:hypothetical protein Q8A73_022550 [Channa argus]|nr:hypothetical protein Q8A73_022550 [Channa argus]